MRIAVIDHGAGNLVSIVAALERLGIDPVVAAAPDALEATDAVILPGVGATGTAMARLNERGLDRALAAWPGPMLGICVGLQLLFDTSDEDGGSCLGVIPGTVRELAGRPLPHMGWNDVHHRGDPLFDGIPSGEPFYFVHSYAPVPEDPAVIIATSAHGGRFTAAVRSGNRIGVQFHPERSGTAGLRLLSNFVRACRQATHAA